MKKLIILAIAVFSSLFIGCTSVPMTSSSLDSEGKQFLPQSGKANIYINRGGGLSGTTQTFQTTLDGRVLGSLAPNTYQLFSVSPGEHTLTVTGAESLEEQKITVEAGKNYFFNVSVTWGWQSGHPHLVSMTEDEGRKEVLNSKRVDATTY